MARKSSGVTVRTVAGDTLDVIVFRHYGSVAGAFEFVLRANRHLASVGPVFPAGIEILLPPMPVQSRPIVRLWGTAE